MQTCRGLRDNYLGCPVEQQVNRLTQAEFAGLFLAFHIRNAVSFLEWDDHGLLWVQLPVSYQ